MRRIKKVHRAAYSPIADLVTYRALPTNSIDYLDPFLFLNHHGPQMYPPNNHGLPFGPHPHRGFETVTIVLEGDILHRDSGGHESVINRGGIQWMTAGRGLIHEEVSSDLFKESGGPLEILQLWVNLPARLKMTDPGYTDIQADQISTISLGSETAVLRLLSGEWLGTKGAYESSTGINLSLLHLENSQTRIDLPTTDTIFFYVIRGKVVVNQTAVEPFHLVEFENNDTQLQISGENDTVILLGHAKPFNEPIVAQGPFVMNTEEEIHQAYADYRAGKFG